MATKTATALHENTEVFVVQGSELIKKIYERAKRHEQEQQKCLEELSDIMTSSKLSEQGGETWDHAICKVAASLMLALGLGTNLTGSALVAKAWLDRAVFLTREIQDLSCLAKNLTPGDYYKVTMEDARRYGMV